MFSSREGTPKPISRTPRRVAILGNGFLATALVRPESARAGAQSASEGTRGEVWWTWLVGWGSPKPFLLSGWLTGWLTGWQVGCLTCIQPFGCLRNPGPTPLVEWVPLGVV